MGSQISGSGMRDGDGCIGSLQHQCHRLPDENAAPDDHGPLAGRVDAIASQESHHPRRCAAARTGFAFQQTAQIQGVKTIGIFLWINGLQQGTFIQPLR